MKDHEGITTLKTNMQKWSLEDDIRWEIACFCWVSDGLLVLAFRDVPGSLTHARMLWTFVRRSGGAGVGMCRCRAFEIVNFLPDWWLQTHFSVYGFIIPISSEDGPGWLCNTPVRFRMYFGTANIQCIQWRRWWTCLHLESLSWCCWSCPSVA